MKKPTRRQIEAMARALDRFVTKRPDNMSQPYCAKVEGFSDGMLGTIPIAPEDERLRKHYLSGLEIGRGLRSRAESE